MEWTTDNKASVKVLVEWNIDMKVILDLFKRASRVLIYFGISIGLVVTIEFVSHLNNYILPWNRAEAIGSALQWSAMADLPHSASDVEVFTRGSAFSRSFELTFTCSKSEITEWLINSDGVLYSQNEPSIMKVQRFIIDVSMVNSNGGWVEVDWIRGKVRLYVEWS